MNISDRMPPVAVEYDCQGIRKVKHFTNPYEARQFFVAKAKTGKRPRVRKVRT